MIWLQISETDVIVNFFNKLQISFYFLDSKVENAIKDSNLSYILSALHKWLSSTCTLRCYNTIVMFSHKDPPAIIDFTELSQLE